MLPFAKGYNEDYDATLVAQVCDGSIKALTELLGHHEPFIFNIAVRMLRTEKRAILFTNTLLVKILLHVHSIPTDCSFRTWLYRIVAIGLTDFDVNNPDENRPNFEMLGRQIDLDTQLPGMNEYEEQCFTQEVSTTGHICQQAALSCLPASSRMLFILQTIFNVPLEEVLRSTKQTPDEITEHKQSGKKQLLALMDKRCGLLRPENPCRCNKRAKYHIDNNIHSTSNDLHHKGLTVDTFISDDSIDTETKDQLASVFRNQFFFDSDRGNTLINTLSFQKGDFTVTDL
jgi:DNA-directed RNA polymerase specialized sigma24 family protein